MSKRCLACPQPLFRRTDESAAEFAARKFCCRPCSGAYSAKRAEERLYAKVARTPVRRCSAPGCTNEIRFREHSPVETFTAWSMRTTCCRKCAAAHGVTSRTRPRVEIEADVLPLLARGLPMVEVARRVGVSMNIVRSICEDNGVREIKRRAAYLPRDTSPPAIAALSEVTPRQVREFWQTPLRDRVLFDAEVRRVALEVGP